MLQSVHQTTTFNHSQDKGLVVQAQDAVSGYLGGDVDALHVLANAV